MKRLSYKRLKDALEIKKRFNVIIVDVWDKVKDTPKKVSNKKVSSYITSSSSSKDSL